MIIVLSFLGLIGLYGYGAYCLKKDIKAEKTDFNVSPSINDNENERIISRNFKNICERSGIKLERNSPVFLEECHLGMEYLEYRGFNQESVNYFTDLYKSKWRQLAIQQKSEIEARHNQILQNFNENVDCILTIRCHVYAQNNPQSRMNNIYNGSPLWNKLVDNYTYIRGQHGNAKFTEIWNLKVNSKYMTIKEAEDIYKEICYLLGYE